MKANDYDGIKERWVTLVGDCRNKTSAFPHRMQTVIHHSWKKH